MSDPENLDTQKNKSKRPRIKRPIASTKKDLTKKFDNGS
jgi:hypothetical protein